MECIGFDINDQTLEEVMNFQQFYPYMCRTKIHPNPTYQKLFEGQREHLDPNNLPVAILIFKNKNNGEIRISHLGCSPAMKEKCQELAGIK